MNDAWEYKVITLEAKGGFFSIMPTPDDDTFTQLLNDEGMRRWELVNVIVIAPSQKLRAVFKRPR